jgi:cellulose synthase/poly-beta-1,6-N-acetylglucosamine synthase-like glycosyltransferase
MDNQLKISIIIPVKPGGEVKALEGLRQIDYPAELYEIIVVEGKQPSVQRNAAAAQAAGDVLYFLDDDSAVSSGFLGRVVGQYADQSVAAVGGPSLTPITDSPFQRTIGLALTSLFGGGGVRNRYRKTGTARKTGEHELILCNLSFRKDLFLASGGLDERLYPNEENELMDRLVKEGRVLVHDPELAVFRSQRPTVKAFVRQMFTYGRGRGEQTLLSGVVKPVTFAPSLFFLYLCLLPFFLTPLHAAPLLGYLLAAVVFAVRESRQGGNLALFPRLLGVFPALHLLYGAGVLWGMVSPRYKKSSQKAHDVVLTKLKQFGEPFH